MKKLSSLYIILFFSLTLCIKHPGKEKPRFKCRYDERKFFEKPSKITIPNERDNIKSFAVGDTGDFKDFNIYLDTENFDYEVSYYHLFAHRDLFLNGMKRAIKTLQSLLKVKPVSKNYQYSDDEIAAFGIYRWDKTKIGNEVINKRQGMQTLGIDLYIFIMFEDNSSLGEGTIAAAGSVYYDEKNKRPLVGIVSINRDIDYSKINSQLYFEITVLHEFTHILGFSLKKFVDLHMLFNRTDIYGIKRSYVNSRRVLQVAKKYYNCNSVGGVPLEEYGGQGTAGSHWEERMLLGDYMIGHDYNEEMVISEFTLAVLEDLGYYQANYYTGGLMRFGKNKGCEFVRSKCVTNGFVNHKFKNEFFDKFKNSNNIDPGCSSGRLSRVYHYFIEYRQPIPKHFVYFNDNYHGGRASAEYCPTFLENMETDGDSYYLGHCSYGSGEYGSFLTISSHNMQYYTNEKLSDHSFCVLSSLVHKSIDDPASFSKEFRAVCYEMHCSDQSLTIEINHEFIVCPRAGGKIQPLNFNGYMLCPDYYLICSGTVLCNDLFDCVDKKSLLKDITYDYEIKTTQDLVESEYDPISEDNYELSNNGKCPQNCRQCNRLGYCISCRNHYKIVEIKINYKINRICVAEYELNNGYYITEPNSIYHKCLDNCDKCENEGKCISCKSGYKLSDNGNSCQKQISILFIIIPSLIISLIIMIIIIFFIVKFLSKGKDLKDDIIKTSFRNDNVNYEEDLIK